MANPSHLSQEALNLYNLFSVPTLNSKKLGNKVICLVTGIVHMKKEKREISTCICQTENVVAIASIKKTKKDCDFPLPKGNPC